MIGYIMANKEFFGIIISFLGVVIPLAIFLVSKNKEQKQINFEKFHTYLIKGISNLKGDTGLDDQVAIIYEFRNYPEYYPVVRRLLHFQIDRWKKELKESPHYSLLIDEAEETFKYIDKIALARLLIRLWSKWF
jgi:hypothetical protein